MKFRPMFCVYQGFVISIAVFAMRDAFAQPPQMELPPIIITSSRVPEEIPLRSVSRINYFEFDRVIGDSITDIVNELPSIDVRERGAKGVQADINIRGATFEESSVLVNCIRMNDPQTAHHNMDIPLTSMDLEAVELVRGGASALYGPDAFGGALNLITKTPGEKEVNAIFLCGQNGYLKEAVSVTQPVKNFRNRISFERSVSSGYRGGDTNFDITTFSFDSLLKSDGSEVEMIGGYCYKDFGASTFYSSRYPKEHETTDTRLGIIRAKLGKDAITVEPKLYYRRHWDRFILDNDRPFWSRNTHKTYTLGADIQTTVTTDLGTVIFGTELSWDKIDSTNIDKHKRNREGLFFGYSHAFSSGFLVNGSVRTDRFSKFGWEFSPQAGIGYNINDRLVLRGAINRAYRIPSFTDLYYSDAANIGNRNLKPESAWSYEIGADYKDTFLGASTTVFNRNATDVIDWVKNLAADPWRAANRGKLDTFGVENIVEIKIGEIFSGFMVKKVSAGYDFINSYKNTSRAAFSKYALDYLRHNASLATIVELPFGVEENFKFSYKRRYGESGYFLLESKTIKRTLISGFDTELYVEGTNLLNTSYEEVAGVAAPGIWIIGGMTVNF